MLLTRACWEDKSCRGWRKKTAPGYLDKLVDELAKGESMERILRR